MNKFLHRALLICLVAFASNALADPKLGYVNVERILKEAPQAAESVKKLQSEFSHRVEVIDALQKHIMEVEKGGAAKEQELTGLKVELERKQQELNEDINIRKNEELAAFQDVINKAVTSAAETEGYDLVLYSGAAYVGKQTDITDKILKSLGKQP